MGKRGGTMKRGVVIVAACLLLLAAAGCGSSSSSSSGGTTTEESGGGGGGQKTIAGVKANDHGTKAVEDKGKTEVELDDFYFKPTVLQGKAGREGHARAEERGQHRALVHDRLAGDRPGHPAWRRGRGDGHDPEVGRGLVLLQVPQELRHGGRARRHRSGRWHRRDETPTTTAAVAAEAAATSHR